MKKKYIFLFVHFKERFSGGGGRWEFFSWKGGGRQNKFEKHCFISIIIKYNELIINIKQQCVCQM